MKTDEKFQVRWNKNRAHLAENGSNKTFCGEQFTFRNGWTVDQPATLDEFAKSVSRKCSACAKNARITIEINKFK